MIQLESEIGHLQVAYNGFCDESKVKCFTKMNTIKEEEATDEQMLGSEAQVEESKLETINDENN